MAKLVLMLVAALAVTAVTADKSEYPQCSEADANAYPAVLDAFSGEFSWGWSSETNGTCWYPGAPRTLEGPADKSVPKCSAEDAAAFTLTPDASGRFSWGWNGKETCWWAEPKEEASPSPAPEEESPSPAPEEASPSPSPSPSP